MNTQRTVRASNALFFPREDSAAMRAEFYSRAARQLDAGD